VKSLIEQYQLPVVAISAPPTSSSKKILAAVDMAKEINCKIIVIQPPKIFDFNYIQWLKNEIPKIRQKENISIALENSSSETLLGIIPGHAMNNLADLKKFKHVCIDTTRVKAKNQDLIEVYRLLKKFLVHIHLSNIKGSSTYYPPQSGILPIESLLTKLKQDGYPAAVSIKVNPKFINVGEDQKMLKSLEEIKEFYDTYFTKIAVVKSAAKESE
jgi:sugar phosphate isomerase/epimerase